MKPVLFAVLLAASGSMAAAQQNPMVGGAPMFASRNIVENAVNSADHTTLVAAVQAAGLVEALQGQGPFTVLAPTNAAFAALPAGAVESLLMPENLAALQTVLTCHVVPTRALWGDVRGMIRADGGRHTITTLGGCQFDAFERAGAIYIVDGQGREARITIADVIQSNGVIHVIDSVLLPTG